MRHYTKTKLELYRNGSMKFWQRHFCAIHLRRCARCQELLESLKADDLFLAELRESLTHFAPDDRDQNKNS